MEDSSELLLELFSEEIPSSMQKEAEEGFFKIFTNSFKNAKIDYTSIDLYSGPRRITIHIKGLPKFILGKKQEIKGPRIDAPSSAIEGFCKANNVTKDFLAQKLFKDQVCYVYTRETLDTSVKDVLMEALPTILKEYVWEKSMRWANYDIRWVRPLHNILCLLDDNVLPIKFGHITANNVTYGHRFMANIKLQISNFDDYKAKLIDNYVVLDRETRCNLITTQLKEFASTLDVKLNHDNSLLEEVVGIVEYPTVLVGRIPEKFLHLPQEVLITSMRTHQKYFTTFDQNGKIAPYFLFVTNIIPNEPYIIISGNEKVLSARLSDALYFYNRDLLSTLESKLPKLSQLIFHDKLGSMKLKAERLKEICSYITPKNLKLQTAAILCKSDLVSEMVGEFPELQGVMGYYYALNDNLGEEVASVIRSHYKPQGLNDEVPKGDDSILALADKVDSLVGLMLSGERSSSSKDPYALRRQALGIIRIILENNINLELHKIIEFVAKLYNKPLNLSILNFLEERVKFYLKNKYDASLINSLLDLKKNSDLVALNTKLMILKDFLKTNEGQNLLIVYKRAKNILDKEEVTSNVNEELFVSHYELDLFKTLKSAKEFINKALSKDEEFYNVLQVLSKIIDPISNFFDNILVKDPDIKIANNRLAILQNIVLLFDKVAKFDAV